MAIEQEKKSLDAEITKIWKSTRTLAPQILPLHDVLRQKYPWYYRWHMNPWSSKFHTALLTLYLVFITSFTYSAIVHPYKTTQATPFAGPKPGATEVLGKRTQYQKVFDNHDDTEQYIISAGPLHYKDGDTWKDIDTQIRSGRGDADFEMSESIYKAQFKKNANAAGLAHVSKDGEGFLMSLGALSWTNEDGGKEQISAPQSVEGQVQDNTITYSDAYGEGLDLVLQTNDASLRKKITIPSLGSIASPATPTSSPTPSETATPAPEISIEPTPAEISPTPSELPPAPPEQSTVLEGTDPALVLGMTYDLDKDMDILIDGELWNRQKISTTAKNIEFQKDGKTIWGMSSPRAWDATYSSSEVEKDSIIDGTLTISATGKKLNLNISFPYSWLKTAQYPVTIDPDTYYGTINDGFIGGYNTSYATARSTSYSYYDYQTNFRVGQFLSGSNRFVRRSYIEFDTSGIDDAAVVTQVNLSLMLQTKYVGGSNFTIRVHKYDWASPMSAGNQETNYDGALASTYDADWQATTAITNGSRYSSSNLATAWVKKLAGEYTKYALLSDRDALGSGTDPTGLEEVYIYSQDHTTQSYRPYLSVTVAVPATRYWINNTSGNWNDTANWSATTGGAGGASVPVSGDTAIFDNAGGTHNGALTINATVNVATLTFDTNYTGTITQGANTITATTAMSLTGASLTLGADLTASGTLTVASGKTLDLAGHNLTVTSTFTNNGTLKMTGGETTVSITNDTDSGTVEYTGTSGPYTIKNWTYYGLKINGAATTFNQPATIIVNDAFNLAAGTYAQGVNQNLTVKGNFTIAAAGATFTKGTGTSTLILDGTPSAGIFTGPAVAQNLGAVQIGLSPGTTDLAADFAADSLTINAADIFNTNGYEVDIGSGGITLATGAPGGTLDTTDDVETDGTIITDAGVFTINSGGVFTKDVTGTRSLVKMDGGTTQTLTTDGDDLGDFQTSTASTLVNLGSAITTEALTIDTNTTIDPRPSTTDYNINATNVTINGTLDATSSAATITASGNWDHSAGTFTKGTSTVTLTGSSSSINAGATYYAGGKTFYNLNFPSSGTTTTTLSSSISLSNSINLGNSTNTITSSSKAIEVWASGTPVSGTNPILTNTGLIYVGSSATDVIGGNSFYNVQLRGTSANVTFTLQGALTVSSSFIVRSNTDNYTSTLNLNGKDVTVTGVGGFQVGMTGNTLRTGVVQNNDATTKSTITTTGLTIYGGGGNNKILANGTQTIDLNVSGNWSNSDTFTAGSSKVSFNKSSSTQTVTAGSSAFNNLTHSGAGTLQLTTNALDVDGILANSAGTFDANDLNVNVAGNFDISGGSFSPDVSPGATTQTVTLDGGGGTTQVVSGSTTFKNLTATALTARQLTFTASTTQTVSGTLTVTGSAGQLITLTSSSPPTQWTINPTAASVSYVDVNYSNNTGVDFCATNSTSTNDTNTNWSISTGATCDDTITLSVDNPTIVFGGLLPGTVVTGTTITTVSTNYGNGYTLAAHDSAAGSDSVLLHTDTTTRIADYSGTIAVPTLWSGTGLGISVYQATGKEAKWGTGTTESDSNNKYAGIPQNATEIHAKTGSPTTNDQTYIGYKLVVPNSQKTGDYSGTITYTATGVLN